MVFRRPPRACGRVLALYESGGGSPAEGHDAADSGRTLEPGRGADVGARLLLPEAILYWQGRPAVAAGPINALRSGGLRVSLQPRWPHRAARPEGSGLSRHEAH